MKFYLYRLMLKATVIGRTAGLRCDSTCRPSLYVTVGLGWRRLVLAATLPGAKTPGLQ
jgi:hypothetical protein